MNELICLGYEFLVSFIPFLAVFFVFRYLHKERGLKTANNYYVAVIIFALYVIAVYHVTGAGTLYDGLRYSLEIKNEQINMIPFSREIAVVPYLLNVVMFVPFGFLVSYIWKKRNRLIHIAGLGFLFSLLIEISQLLNNRSTDIDDLLLNTLGGIVGAIFYKLFFRNSKAEKKMKGVSQMELPVYVLVMFLGRFLLFDEVGIAKLLYKF